MVPRMQRVTINIAVMVTREWDVGELTSWYVRLKSVVTKLPLALVILEVSI